LSGNSLMALDSLADFLEAAAACMAAARLFFLGLAERQSALLIYLVVAALAAFALGTLPPASPAYFWLFIAYVVVNWVVSIYAVREMFALALDRYPGIRTVGRWAMYGATGLSVAASLAITPVFWNGGRHGESHLFYVQVVNRSVVFSLAVIVAAILVFLARYPLHLHRNTYVSTSCFSAVFLSEAAVMLVDNLSPHLYSAQADRLQTLFVAACFTGWALMLRPETEAATVSRTIENPAEKELLQRLESFNSLLARAGRR
jgi:hypothetical protein